MNTAPRVADVAPGIIGLNLNDIPADRWAVWAMRRADGRLGLNVDRTPGGYPVVVAPVPDGLESGDVVMLIGGRPVPETVTLAEALGPPQPTHEVTVLRHSASPRRPAPPRRRPRAGP